MGAAADSPHAGENVARRIHAERAGVTRPLPFPAPASLTNGNVGDLPPPGNDIPKTGLPG